MKIVGQKSLLQDLERLMTIFVKSNGIIRPHFILTGASGTGKSLAIKYLANKMKIQYIELNAAQLTKEGTAGNSISKALSILRTMGDKPKIIFVDEFDKLFISGNNNSDLASDWTIGVQNEFLKLLENGETQVFGDYGKFITVSLSKVLFVFSGAFNGEQDITLDSLRKFGLKTEFLGRVGLIYNTKELSANDLYDILEHSELLESYLNLFSDVDKEVVVLKLKQYIKDNHENNTLGARMINTLIHQYFIKGGLPKKEVKKITFQEKIKFKKE